MNKSIKNAEILLNEDLMIFYKKNLGYLISFHYKHSLGKVWYVITNNGTDFCFMAHSAIKWQNVSPITKTDYFQGSLKSVIDIALGYVKKDFDEYVRRAVDYNPRTHIQIPGIRATISKERLKQEIDQMIEDNIL